MEGFCLIISQKGYNSNTIVFYAISCPCQNNSGQLLHDDYSLRVHIRKHYVHAYDHISLAHDLRIICGLEQRLLKPGRNMTTIQVNN